MLYIYIIPKLLRGSSCVAFLALASSVVRMYTSACALLLFFLFPIFLCSLFPSFFVVAAPEKHFPSPLKTITHTPSTLFFHNVHSFSSPQQPTLLYTWKMYKTALILLSKRNNFPSTYYTYTHKHLYTDTNEENGGKKFETRIFFFSHWWWLLLLHCVVIAKAFNDGKWYEKTMTLILTNKHTHSEKTIYILYFTTNIPNIILINK